MHLLDQRMLGNVALFLLGMLVIVKRMATGSILDKPKGNLVVQLVNIFNLFFLLGGSAPRSEDKMVMDGPYGMIRHPMYAAALSISLGLACLIQSWAFLGVFCLYLVLILLLIPMEEDGLRKAHGEQYVGYQQKAGQLIPFVY